MSYDKVKSIKIDEKQGKVFFNTASNNVRPLTYSVFSESKIYNDLLKEEGKEAVEIEILKEYESGNLQDGKNKYTKALKILRYIFQEEYKELLKKALNYKFPKTKFVITKSVGEIVYGKVCPTCIKWSRLKEKATKFDFREEAEDHIYNDYKGIWKVEELE